MPAIKFHQLDLDRATGVYFLDSEPVRITKSVDVCINGVQQNHKLSFTRSLGGVPTEFPVPCLKLNIDGPVKVLLDGTTEFGEDIEVFVAEHCIEFEEE